MAYLKYEIKKKYGVIGESPNGWKKELNFVSWNERAPKFDIRDWEPGYKKMGRGVTLTKAEAAQLKKVLSSINFDEVEEVHTIEIDNSL